MSDLVTLDPVIDNPGIRAAASRALHIARLAAFKAAANQMDPAAYPLPGDPKSLERILAGRLATRPAAAQHRAVDRARQLQVATAKVRGRMFGDLDKIDLRSASPIAAQAAGIPVRGAVAHASAATPVAHPAGANRAGITATPAGSGAAPPPKPGEAPSKTLTLRIHRVICAHSTNDGIGVDEIKLGGVLIDPAGKVTARAAFKVSDSFVDPGDEDDDSVSSVTYDPPHDFFHWSFASSGDDWPKSYKASLILCEEDEGGFTGFLLDLASALKDIAEPLLTELGPIGALLSFLLDGLFGWLKQIWEDDPFHPITVHADIDSAHDTFANGTHTSDLKKYWTTMGIGKYWIYFDWKIST